MSTLTRKLSLPVSTGRSLWPFHAGAIADVGVGLDLHFFADPIASLVLPQQATILGYSSAAVLQALGAFLLVFAIGTVVVARAQGTLARYRSWIVLANAATVVLAVLILAFGHAAFSAAGIAAVAVVAAALALLAGLQRRALQS